MKNRKSKADKRAGIKANKVINPSTDISNIIIPPVETSVTQHLFGNSLFGDSSPVTLEKLWLLRYPQDSQRLPANLSVRYHSSPKSNVCFSVSGFRDRLIGII